MKKRLLPYLLLGAGGLFGQGCATHSLATHPAASVTQGGAIASPVDGVDLSSNGSVLRANATRTLDLEEVLGLFEGRREADLELAFTHPTAVHSPYNELRISRKDLEAFNAMIRDVRVRVGVASNEMRVQISGDESLATAYATLETKPRTVLFYPSTLKTFSLKELEGVAAHEIAHVRYGNNGPLYHPATGQRITRFRFKDGTEAPANAESIADYVDGATACNLAVSKRTAEKFDRHWANLVFHDAFSGDASLREGDSGGARSARSFRDIVVSRLQEVAPEIKDTGQALEPAAVERMIGERPGYLRRFFANLVENQQIEMGYLPSSKRLEVTEQGAKDSPACRAR